MHKSMLLLTLLPLCSALILGQTNQMKAGQPPKYLQIIVEEVRAGKMAAHNNLEAEWTDGLKKAAIKAHSLGASSVAGQSEAVWLLLHDGLGEIEALREEEATNSALRSVVERYSGQDSDYITGHSTMLARRRDDLSYRPDFNFGEYRFLAIHTFHTKLAHARDAMEVLKIFNTAREKSGSEIHIVVYEVMSGAAEGTFLSIVPRKSLAGMEQGDQRMQQAVGEELWRRVRELADAGGFTLDNTLFALDPRWSNVPEEMAAANPNFWNAKRGEAKPSNSRSRAGPRTP
jgi:hypothetical protein